MTPSVCAVVVAYHSDPNRLTEVVAALTPQCAFIVADNTDDVLAADAVRRCAEQHGGTYLPMGGNRGIGAAQNAAIGAAWQRGARAVLLLDDDSIPAPDVVTVLMRCNSGDDDRVCSANALDAEGREIGNARHLPGPEPRCRELMNSGTLIRRGTFDAVGPFDEALFIDGVDFDWGWRAQARGMRLVVTRSTSITHRLGIGTVGGVRMPSPIRHYYQFRNVLRLMRRPHTPWTWRAAQAVKLPTKLVLIALLMPHKQQRLRYALRGVVDALRGVGGPWRPR